MFSNWFQTGFKLFESVDPHAAVRARRVHRVRCATCHDEGARPRDEGEKGGPLPCEQEQDRVQVAVDGDQVEPPVHRRFGPGVR